MASIPDLEGLSRKKRQFKLEAFKNTCREYIQNKLSRQFGEVVRTALANSNIDATIPNVVIDADDPDAQACCFGIHP